MDIHVIALFPELLEPFVSASVLGRGVEQGLLRVHPVQLRAFSTNKHRTVDDTPYGGGSGMVLMAPPVVAAIESLPVDPSTGRRPHTVLLTPQGRPFTQATAQALARRGSLALVCGRYEGFDERIRAYVDEELSLGDFVLTGGEVAAAVVVDAVARLLPGVLGNAESALCESHAEEGLLEHPQYTRPAEFRGVAVPPVLVSGDHGRVARWRRWQALRRTRERRPELFARLALTDRERAALDGDEP
ncbi:MAG: tRNA (guanosine(37)-N1)-methyltransferase TrmD [Deltaproteobacteria bacterium]|nr:tRNA (guanosine(37)-N1)-methyltransferase TrmD [Deltaproteobacteria bacterium]